MRDRFTSSQTVLLGIVLGISITCLMGSVLGIDALKTFGRSNSAMVPTTACALISLCAAFVISTRRDERRRALALTLFALFVMLLGLILGTRVDEESALANQAPPARMSIGTFVCLCYAASVIWLRLGRRAHYHALAVILCGSGFFSSLYGLFSHTLPANTSHLLPLFGAMSVPTAIVLSVFFFTLMRSLQQDADLYADSSVTNYLEPLALSAPLLFSPVVFAYAMATSDPVGFGSSADDALTLCIVLAAFAFIAAFLVTRPRTK
ncbi:hypothetical protein [Henriciella algicola]|uniref:hypothetical protein n=1 Tax=Henriciella algicola TaxID=1608422 RepID=UPI0011C39CA6|nr:hypothetical protein [Henriciella algicola]